MVGLLLGLVLAGPAVPLEVGRSVRVQLVDDTGRAVQLEGRLVGLSQDGFRVSNIEGTRDVSFADVRQIQRRHRERSTTVLHAAGVGLLAGALVGATWAGISNDEHKCDIVFGCLSDNEASMIGGVGYGVLGLVTGALVGSTLPARWDEAIPGRPEAAMSLTPVRRGLGLQLRLRF